MLFNAYSFVRVMSLSSHSIIVFHQKYSSWRKLITIFAFGKASDLSAAEHFSCWYSDYTLPAHSIGTEYGSKTHLCLINGWGITWVWECYFRGKMQLLFIVCDYDWQTWLFPNIKTLIVRHQPKLFPSKRRQIFHCFVLAMTTTSYL